MAVTELEIPDIRGQVTSALRVAGAFSRRALSEPLVHFVIAGAVLFAAGRYYQQETSLYRIVITPRHVAQLANAYALQFGTLPDKPTLKALVDQDIHDEILLRQGLALKLDQGDEIVRRRVVQKMQFLMQDMGTPAEPTEAQLQAYYKAHLNRYTTPPRVTFSHIFFAEGGDAEGRARAVLSSLANSVTRAPDRGDPFPDLTDFSAYEPDQVKRLFGNTPFAEAVFSVAPGHWAGPFRSAYGWHLIYVDARQPSHPASFASVRNKVREDYRQDLQDKANADAFNKLAQRFTIVRQDTAQ